MARNEHDWMVFSSHGQVLVYLALFPEATLRQVSDALGLTERHVSRMIQDLEAGGMLTVRRGGPGRRNSYAVNRAAP
jgi:DNA-binding MarR family transcriptional regulator